MPGAGRSLLRGADQGWEDVRGRGTGDSESQGRMSFFFCLMDESLFDGDWDVHDKGEVCNLASGGFSFSFASLVGWSWQK